MSSQVGDFVVRAGLVGEGAALDAAPASLHAPNVHVPSVYGPRKRSRSNVLAFVPRRPEVGVSPSEALRRVRLTTVAAMVSVSFVAAVVGVVLARPAVVIAALCWLCAEVVLIYLSQHLDELGDVGATMRRLALYAMAACVVGVAIRDPDRSLRAMAALAAMGATQLAVMMALRHSAVRRAIGVSATPGVLVVADRSTAIQSVEDRAALGSSKVIGICLVDALDRGTTIAGVPVLGGAHDVMSVVTGLNIHEVVVRLEAPLDDEWLRDLQWSLEEVGARLTIVTGLRNARARRVRVRAVGNSIVMGISQARPTGLARHLKSATEAVLALAGMVVALPLLAACAVAVKLDSPGPALFRQTRVRDGDRTFTMYKLRTMSIDAEARRAELDVVNEVGGGLFKMQVDPRVTRVGRVLRKLSLDELPQLVNVIRGEMSLIGPRPALPSEVETYDARARRRLRVKPGLTGLWQVSGRSRLTWDESISLDIDYVDNWSAGRDVRIAVETVRAVVRKDGAY